MSESIPNPTQEKTGGVTYTPEERIALIDQQIKLVEQDRKKEDSPEAVVFKKYYDRYLSGEVSEEELKIYDGDYIAVLKDHDRKKSSNFIDGEGWKARRNGIATLNNRPLTDMGNAERLVDQFGSLIRYCHQMKDWYVWNFGEGRWKIDENGHINRISKDVVRRILYEATVSPTVDLSKKTFSWGIQCECKTHLTGMIDIAQSDKHVLVSPDDFDKNDLLFNMRNGTFNLETLVLEEHKKENNVSKLVNYDYNQKSTCPLFLGYLDRIFRSNPNKTEIIKFLQRAVGYTLTGLTKEECLFLLYGSGANGKSVFLEILHALTGEYGTTINSRSFTTDRGEQTNDIASLVGKRYVSASENNSASKLDEELVKKLTGKDLISARFLYKEPFNFKPKFKLWWAFNHPPVISDMTNSMWRRVKIIPFTEVIPDAEMDKTLAEKIIKDELPGVFNWAVEGLNEYNQYGLQQPEVVTKATQQYKNEQDILREFFEFSYEFTESELDQIKASDLYTSYKAWWINIEPTPPLSSTKFGRLCRDRGMTKIDTRTGLYYVKIRSVHQTWKSS